MARKRHHKKQAHTPAAPAPDRTTLRQMQIAKSLYIQDCCRAATRLRAHQSRHTPAARIVAPLTIAQIEQAQAHLCYAQCAHPEDVSTAHDWLHRMLPRYQLGSHDGPFLCPKGLHRHSRRNR